MLQLITTGIDAEAHFNLAELALRGGCRWIQMYSDHLNSVDAEALALRLKNICLQYHATFVVSSDLNLALKVGADGVHLRKCDMPVSAARMLVPPNFIIGATANNLEDMVALAHEGVNYIRLHPFRGSESSRTDDASIGVVGFSVLMDEFRSHGYRIPVVAAGGITIDDIPFIMPTGVIGVTICKSIASADDPKLMAATFLHEIAHYKFCNRL